MTNQEAIKRIKEHIAIHKYREPHAIHIVEALEMAISALQTQDSETRRICDTCKYDPPSKKWPCVDCDMRDPADRWDQLELSKNSTELDKKNGELQPTCNQLATDTIYRQAAIDAIDKALSRTFAEPCGEMILKDVPSAQPEIIRCKDCKHNNNCHIQYHAQAGDMFFCGAAERRTDEFWDS